MSGRGDPRSIHRHMVVLAAATSGVTAILLVLLVQVLLAGASESAADRLLRNDAEEVVAAAEATTEGDRVAVPDSILKPGVVVYDERGRPVAGRPPGALAEVYPDVMSDAPVSRTVDDAYRVRSVPIATSSGGRGVVVVATRMEPYEQIERAVLLVTLAAGVVLVVSSVAVAAAVSRRVLRPVSEMARTAEEWSERDLSRRFDLGPPDNELTSLAATLDGLLDKVARAILAEQRLTAELAHELRTPLSAIQGNAELLELRGGVDPESREELVEIRRGCRRMGDTITTLLELARTASSSGAPASARVEDVLAEVVSRVHPEAPSVVTANGTGPAGLVVDAPLDLVVRAVLPVVENAGRFGSRVRLVVETDGPVVKVHVDDDGPGLGGLGDDAFEAGVTSGGTGAGLGLALSRRVARSLGGEVSAGLVDDPPYGTRFTVELPRARSADQWKTKRR